MGLRFIPDRVRSLAAPGPASARRDGASVCLPLWPRRDGQTVPREQEGAGSAGDIIVAVPCISLLVDGGEALESVSLHVGSVCPLLAVTAMQVGPPLPALTGQHPPPAPAGSGTCYLLWTPGLYLGQLSAAGSGRECVCAWFVVQDLVGGF